METASAAAVRGRPRGGSRAAARATPEKILRALIRRLGRELHDHPSEPEADCGGESGASEAESDGSRTLLELSMNGSRYVVRCEPTAPVLVPPPAPPADPDASTGVTLPGLSPREHEIARMIAKGHPNKTIAMVLEISCWTVGTHVRRIFAKLGVGSRAAMIAKLMADGWSGELEPHPIACDIRDRTHVPQGVRSVANCSDRLPLADDRSSCGPVVRRPGAGCSVERIVPISPRGRLGDTIADR